MRREISYVSFNIPQEDHQKLKMRSAEQGCSLKSLLQEAVHVYASAPVQRISEPASDQTIQMKTELCDTVFYMARYAEYMEINKTISVPDERELFLCIYDWAEKFEQAYDPNSDIDHQTMLEEQGVQWLLETFPYIPELDTERTAIIDFINFEENSSGIWPWAASAEDMLQNETLLRDLERAVHFDAHGEFDTDELYDAIDRIVGVNPELVSAQEKGAEMTMPGM